MLYDTFPIVLRCVNTTSYPNARSLFRFSCGSDAPTVPGTTACEVASNPLRFRLNQSNEPPSKPCHNSTSTPASNILAVYHVKLGLGIDVGDTPGVKEPLNTYPTLLGSILYPT